MLGHTLRLPEDTPGNKAIKQYYQRKVEQTDVPRKSTNRGRVLTTLPRLLQLDLTRKLSARERNENFAITGLKNGTDLAILRRKAENRDNWRDSVKILVHKEQQLWNARDQKKKTKRDELRAARHQERTQRQRTIQDYFGRRT